MNETNEPEPVCTRCHRRMSDHIAFVDATAGEKASHVEAVFPEGGWRGLYCLRPLLRENFPERSTISDRD